MFSTDSPDNMTMQQAARMMKASSNAYSMLSWAESSLTTLRRFGRTIYDSATRGGIGNGSRDHAVLRQP